MNLFTYGTLIHPEIMAKVAGATFESKPGMLQGYQRKLVKDEVYPGIREHPESSVEGVVYFNITPAALQRLDYFEGEMYERHEVNIIHKDNTTTHAQTYVIRPEYEHHLSNQDWSYDEFLQSCKSQFEGGYFGFDLL